MALYPSTEDEIEKKLKELFPDGAERGKVRLALLDEPLEKQRKYFRDEDTSVRALLAKLADRYPTTASGPSGGGNLQGDQPRRGGGVGLGDPAGDGDEAGSLLFSDEGARAIHALDHLAQELGLSKDFNGFSLLLLSEEKLRFWWKVQGHTEDPDFSDLLNKIKKAAWPLSLSVDEAPFQKDRERELGTTLHAVDREVELGHLFSTVTSWELQKTQKKEAAKSRANMLTCGHYNGQGKTTLGDLVQDPPPEALDHLATLLEAKASLLPAIHWVLACLRINMRVGNLGNKDEYRSENQALAMLIFEAFKSTVKSTFNLDISLHGSLSAPRSVIRMIRNVVGPKTGLFLQFDESDALAEHAKEGGWFSGAFSKLEGNRISPLKQGQSNRALTSNDRIVQEMDGVYGVWHALKSTINEHGVFIMFSGRTPVPYLLGRKYIQYNTPSPGHTFPIGLRPMSQLGLCTVIDRTLCTDGSNILKALGFSQEALDELAPTLRRPRQVRDFRPPGESSLAPRLASEASTKELHEFAREGGVATGQSAPVLPSRSNKRPPLPPPAQRDPKRQRGFDNPGAEAGDSSIIPSGGSGVEGIPADDPSGGFEGGRQTELPELPDPRSPPSTSTRSNPMRQCKAKVQAPAGPPAEDQEDSAADQAYVSERQRKGKGHIADEAMLSEDAVLSEEARKLLLFTSLTLWSTCGVPLLVRHVLAAAVRKGLRKSWAEYSEAEIRDAFVSPDSSLQRAVRDNERSLAAGQFSDLSTLEKQKLLLQALLQQEIELEGKHVLMEAVVRASIYTKAPERQTEMLSPSKAASMHDENLFIVPQLPPPMVVSSLDLAINGPGYMLAAAMQVDPDLVNPGYALEVSFRHCFAAGLIRASVTNASMAVVFPYLNKWMPAKKAELTLTKVLTALPGYKESSNPVYGDKPTRAQLLELKKSPWKCMLPPEEAPLVMTVLGKHAIGMPHPKSAGEDIILQGGLSNHNPPNEPTRVLALHQLKWRGSDSGGIGVPDIAKELERSSLYAEGYRKEDNTVAVCLVYVVLGNGHTKEVAELMGKVLGPGKTVRKGKKRDETIKVPKNLSLVIPSKSALENLLGKDALAAFEDMRLKPEGTQLKQVEKLAEMLGKDTDSAETDSDDDGC